MPGCTPEERRERQRAWVAAARAKRRANPDLYEADKARDRRRKAEKREAAAKLAPPKRAKGRALSKEARYKRAAEMNRLRLQRIKREDPARYRAMLDRLAERRAAKGPKAHPPLSPEQHARRLETQRQRRALAAGQRVTKPTGSVLVTAAPSAWRDTLAAIGQLVPRLDNREDVIAEAALLAVQGVELHEAVRQAKRTVNAGSNFYRYAKPIQDCHWI